MKSDLCFARVLAAVWYTGWGLGEGQKGWGSAAGREGVAWFRQEMMEAGTKEAVG